MTEPWDERPQLDPAEQQFIARLVAHYTPPPLTPTSRVRLNEALWVRLQRRRRLQLVPVMATVAVATVVAWLALPGVFTPTPRGGEPPRRVVEIPRSGLWEYALIYPRDLTGASEDSDSTLLPDEYQVIAQVFLDVP